MQGLLTFVKVYFEIRYPMAKKMVSQIGSNPPFLVIYFPSTALNICKGSHACSRDKMQVV